MAGFVSDGGVCFKWMVLFDARFWVWLPVLVLNVQMAGFEIDFDFFWSRLFWIWSIKICRFEFWFLDLVVWNFAIFKLANFNFGFLIWSFEILQFSNLRTSILVSQKKLCSFISSVPQTLRYAKASTSATLKLVV